MGGGGGDREGGNPAEVAARKRERRATPAEVAAREEREERVAPKSEGGRDKTLFGPMGGEGKCCVGNRREVGG